MAGRKAFECDPRGGDHAAKQRGNTKVAERDRDDGASDIAKATLEGVTTYHSGDKPQDPKGENARSSTCCYRHTKAFHPSPAIARGDDAHGAEHGGHQCNHGRDPRTIMRTL